MPTKESAQEIGEVFASGNRPKAEERFIRYMHRRGYRIISKGWPDFILINADGRVRMVEVKSKNDHLKPHQLACLALLHDYGFDVRVHDHLRKNPEGRKLAAGELETGHAILLGKPKDDHQEPLKIDSWGIFKATDDSTYSIAQIAKLFGVSQQDIISLIKQRILSDKLIKSTVLISRHSLIACLRRLILLRAHPGMTPIDAMLKYNLDEY